MIITQQIYSGALKMEAMVSFFDRILVLCFLSTGLFAHAFEGDVAILVSEPIASSERTTSVIVYKQQSINVEFLKAIFKNGNSFIYQPVVNNINDGIRIETEGTRTTLRLSSSEDQSRKVGIYKVALTRGTDAANVTFIISSSDAVLEPVGFLYSVLSKGNDLSLQAQHVTGTFPSGSLRWRHNGRAFGNTRASLTFTEQNITVDDQGIYECFRSGNYRQYQHAIMSVIVRGCKENRYGLPNCEDECSPCENGGVCSDESGSCLCPPGFSGQRCEVAHGRNVFGQSGQYKCNEAGDDYDDGCRGLIICYPGPFGCSCPAGYRGNYCNEDCEEGKYGANCAQDCTCEADETCATDTGECTRTQSDDSPTPSPVLPRYRNEEILIFTTVTSSSITVEWPEWQEGVDVGTGSISGYILYWSRSFETFRTESLGLTRSYTFNQLEADTNYSFSVAVIGPDNVVGPPSVPQTQKTLCAEISTPILFMLSKRTKAITFYTQLPTLEELTCSERNYTIWIQRELQSGLWINIKELNTDSHVIVRGLLPCSSYRFRVEISSSSTYPSATSNIVPVTTDPEEPGRVENIAVTAPSPGILDVSWNSPDNTNNPCVASYIVTYRLLRHLACQNEEFNTQVHNISTVNLEERLSNLEDYAEYEISVLPVITTSDSQTLEGERATRTGRTLPSAPYGTVGQISPVVVGNSLEFSWIPLPCTNINGPALRYKIQLYQVVGGRFATYGPQIITNSTYRFTNLKYCANYRFAVTTDNTQEEGDRTFWDDVQTDSAALDPVQGVSWGRIREDIEVTWTAPDNTNNLCPIQDYLIRYSINRHLGCDSPVQGGGLAEVSTTSTTYTLTNLSPYTLYRVKVAARGVLPETDGPFLTDYASTARKAPSFAPVAHANSAARTLVLTWDAIPCEDLNGAFRGYDITITGTGKTEHIFDENQNSNKTTFTDLKPCTQYELTIRVVNNEGDGPIRRIVSTTEVESPGNDFNLRLQAEDEKTIVAVWDRPHSHPCTITDQTIRIETVDKDGCNDNITESESFTLRSGVRSRRFENLTPNSLYRISLWASNSAGRGNNSEPKEQRTRQSEPDSAPEDVEVRKTSSTSLKFAWSRPPCGSRNGNIIKYHCKLRTNGVEINSQATSKRVHFDNLVPFTNYSFKVSAVTRAGEGPFSSPLWIRTNESYPPQLGQPEIESSNTSAIQIRWQIPDPPHGVILSYDILIQSNESSGRNYSETFIVSSSEAGNAPTFSITDLESNTRFLLQVRASTRVGPGNWSEPLIQATGEGNPGEPSNVHVTGRTFTSIKIEWDEPVEPNGRITMYEVRFRAIEKSYLFDFRKEDYTSKTIEETGSHIVHEITPLEPSTAYLIEISAYTLAGKGESVLLTNRTELKTDLEPVKQMFTTPERKDTTAIITIPALTQTYATGYFVRVKHKGNSKRDAVYPLGYEENPTDYITAQVNKSDKDIKFTVGDNKMYGQYHNAPLQKDHEYEVFVAPVTAASGDVFVGDWSDPVIIPVSHQFPWALVIILIFLIVVASVIIFLVVVYRRRQEEKQNEKEHNARSIRERTERPEIVMVPNDSHEEIEMKTNSLKDQNVTNARKPPVAARLRKSDKVIKIADLAAYVKRKKTSESENFFEEYETLPDSILYPWDVAAKPENKKKNRYGNIIPYNSSRVILEVYNNDPHSDYINASYIDGYNYPTKYIACHGPNTASVKDFWRMVWQEDVGKIVMLTNLVEMGKKKCEKYWPDEALKYANVIVKLQEECHGTSYTVRTFELSLVDGEEIKIVRQYHFTSWPDMKVPEFAGPILDLLQLVRSEESHQPGPMVVHCSAGVGRTGTFIALDAMLDMAAAEDRVNVYQFVCQMRQNRIKMVQIPEQYQFIFDALVEYFVIGNTSIQVDDFRSDLARLNDINIGSGKSYLQEQYETLELTSIVPPVTKFKGGRDSANKCKNRFGDRLPVDTYRPYLMTDVGDLGNNYINASFLSGYRKKDMFLGTQMPLENTVTDFWRMVWDYNSHVIIMLNDMDSHQNMAKYWHESGAFTCEPFSIQLLSCEDITGIRCRTLEITNSSQSFENPRPIKHIQCLNWPNSDTTPDDPKTLLHAVNMLSQWDAESEAGPITIHCIDGIGRTGLFCTLVSALDQVKAERKVDIFQLVNKLRSSRPNMVDSFEQYKSVFDVTLMHLEEDEMVYENFRR